MDETYSGSGIATFQISRSDMFPNAFTVGLKIKQKHRITGMKKKFGLIHQLQSVGANSVHQDDNAFVRLSRDKPAMNYSAAGTLKLNQFNWQISRWFSNFAIAWGDKNISSAPGEYQKGNGSNENSAGEYF
jgi:hypothetical protein